jgi:drug/metabolite transporter (DMT)-like permease
VAYVLGVVKFADWSSLRYTALTAVPGTLAILVITVAATAIGVAHVPGATDLRAVAWPTVYLVLATGVAGVLAWNRSIQLLGPLNAVLLGNLIPVVTFAITGWQGTRFTVIEIGGALLVLAALVANNLYLRRKLAAAPGRRPAA